MKDKSRWILVAVVAFVLAVNILVSFSYGINIGDSDNVTFTKMIALGTSDLMHASGYPAVLHLLTHKFLPSFKHSVSRSELNFDFPPSWFDQLQQVQLFMHLLLFLISIYLCTKVFGREAAVILALGWGCSVLFMSNVNATAPEWLEGHALILTILLHAYARNLAGKKKVLVYCFAAFLFGLSYLIKFNALIFAIPMVAFLLFDKESWRFKALQMLSSAAIVFLVIWIYASSYHYHSTGTRTLNFDHAWVLTASLPEDYITASPERLGINSLRWAVLARMTPRDYFRAGSVTRIEYGPAADVRIEYRNNLEMVFRMSREELFQYMRDHPLPQGYSQWSSAVPLYYYYGLEKADALGTAVYFESFRSHPGFHITKVWNSLTGVMAHGLKTRQPFPTFVDPRGFTFSTPDFNASFAGETLYTLPPVVNTLAQEYYSVRPWFLSYGVKVVEVLNAITSVSILYFALNIICLFGMLKLKSDVSRITAFSLLIALGAFISASGILLGLRQKEIITMTPLYFLLMAIGLISAAEWCIQAVAQRRADAVAVNVSGKHSAQAGARIPSVIH